MRIMCMIAILFAGTLFSPGQLTAQGFSGFDSATLPPVTNKQGDWGLRIVIMNVGQADAILVMAPNCDTAL